MYNLSHNPWSNDEKSTVPLRNALVLADKCGYLNSRIDFKDKPASDRLRDTNSVKLITLQRDITRLKKELNETNLELQRFLQDKETRDITHLEEIEKKTENVKSLNTYLQTIISQKEELIGRLQQPFVGDFIRLDASYHKYATQLFPQIAPLLADLSVQLNSISWVKQTDFTNSRMDSVVSELAHALAMLQTNFQALRKSRESVSDFHNVSITSSD